MSRIRPIHRLCNNAHLFCQICNPAVSKCGFAIRSPAYIIL